MGTATTDLLAEAPQKVHNRDWLLQHNQTLPAAIRQALKRGGEHDAGILALLYILPYFTQSEEIKRWHKFSRKALKISRARKRRETTTDAIRNLYVLSPQKLESAPPRKKRSERVDPRELFETYLNLLMESFFAYPQWFTPELLDRLLYLTRQINMPYYYHKVYQVLALIYNYFGEYDKALDRLYLAQSYWQRHPNTLEMALTTYAIAMAYRGKNDREQTRHWLEVAAELFDQVNLPESRALVAVELAALET